MNRDKIGTQTCYIHQCTKRYVDVHSMSVSQSCLCSFLCNPYIHFKFPKFFIYLYIYTTLVCLLFGTVIPTSFKILMEMFLLPCFTVFLLYRKSIKPYSSTIWEFCAVQLRLYGCVGPSHFHSQYARWRVGIQKNTADSGNRVDQHL